MLLTVFALGLALLSIGSFTYAAMTEWRQLRDRGPIALVPTLPIGVAAPVILTMALRFLGRAHSALGLPWWGYVSFWFGSSAIAIVVLRMVSRSGR
ncbi:MAG TPA: hypothetical protein VGZ27_00225 [Vicinamibacterales bacterium]|nr:hypothetical protein [Vicinamibacterales bacterium]